MPAGERKIPEPIVIPITSATELQSPRVRGSRDGGALALISGGRLAHGSLCHLFASLVRCGAMLPANRSRSDGALDAALERIGGRDVDRPDSPDLHVTAVRRLPAVGAQLVPFPDTLDSRLTLALASRGVEQLYTHQADAIDHALAGRHTVVTTPTASGKTLCYNAPSSRRCARRSIGRTASASASSPTTATRRRMHAARFGLARISSSAIRTWCTQEFFRTIHDGQSCSRTCATS